MHNPLFWIEWLDRLDRVLTSARQDVALLKRAVSPRGLEAIDRSKRQLAALLNDLRLLNPDVLAASAATTAAANVVAGAATGAAARENSGAADALQAALEATVVKLGNLAEIPAASAPGVLDRMLAVSDAALRDSCYEAAMLLVPHRRRA